MPDRKLRTARFLKQAHSLAREGAVLTTAKADDEMIELGWEHQDLCEQLEDLVEVDFLRTERSRYDDNALLWVFCPPHWTGGHLWLRLAELGTTMILVVSIHPAGGDPWKS